MSSTPTSASFSSSPPNLSSVLQALDSLYKTTETQARNQANQWLQEFQKTVSFHFNFHTTTTSSSSRIHPALLSAYLTFSSSLLPLLSLQPEAWEIANELLLSQELPLEPRVFASQTFRSKVRQRRDLPFWDSIYNRSDQIPIHSSPGNLWSPSTSSYSLSLLEIDTSHSSFSLCFWSKNHPDAAFLSSLWIGSTDAVSYTHLTLPTN